jgi:hypothetical protein
MMHPGDLARLEDPWGTVAALLNGRDPWDAALGVLCRDVPYERPDRPGLLYTAEEHQLQDEYDAHVARTDAKYNLPPQNTARGRRIQ